MKTIDIHIELPELTEAHDVEEIERALLDWLTKSAVWAGIAECVFEVRIDGGPFNADVGPPS